MATDIKAMIKSQIFNFINTNDLSLEELKIIRDNVKNVVINHLEEKDKADREIIMSVINK